MIDTTQACGPSFGDLYWLVFLIRQFLLGTVALVALTPSIVVAQWQDRRQTDRLRRGLCRRCGYDLRATPGRCPECGLSAPRRRAGRAGPRPMTRAAGEPVLRPTVVCAYP